MNQVNKLFHANPNQIYCAINGRKVNPPARSYPIIDLLFLYTGNKLSSPSTIETNSETTENKATYGC